MTTEAKLGHPLAHNHGLTTVGDELRLDERGRPVVGPNQPLWSDAGTDLFLYLASEPSRLNPEPPFTNSHLFRRSALSGLTVWIAVTRGKPRTTRDCLGAGLELPLDLAEDPNKKEYLTAWIAATVQEICPPHVATRKFYKDIGEAAGEILDDSGL